MGNLHAGHIALVKKAGQRADFVVASIFVNPLQFGPNEDRTTTHVRSRRTGKLFDAGCHLLFAPSVEEMYPTAANQTIVRVPGVSEGLCGGSRPGHFDGVSTVVSKLFNMVLPDLAVFGQKDFQQLAVIRTMVRDLNMPVQILRTDRAGRRRPGTVLAQRLPERRRACHGACPLSHAEPAQGCAPGRSSGPSRADRRRSDALRSAGLRPDHLTSAMPSTCSRSPTPPASWSFSRRPIWARRG